MFFRRHHFDTIPGPPGIAISGLRREQRAIYWTRMQLASTTFPSWLQEHCARLRAKDDELKNLNLNIRRLDARMMAFLAEAMRENDVLLVLNLTSSLAGHPSALIPLAQVVLPYHKSLKILHLSYNRIENVSSLGKALATNTKLEEVYLSYNLINEQGAQALAEGLLTNHTLRVLCLNYNVIGDQGCQALARALERNRTLLDLSVARNSITSAGAASLERALLVNDTIRTINLESNSLDPDQVASIQIFCRANQFGRHLLLTEEGSNNPALWPSFLERLKNDPDLLYFFLHLRPDLCLSPSAREEFRG